MLSRTIKFLYIYICVYAHTECVNVKRCYRLLFLKLSEIFVFSESFDIKGNNVGLSFFEELRN